MRIFFLIFILVIQTTHSIAQQSFYVHTKEGRPIFTSKQLIEDCLESLHKTHTDGTAVSICQCQTDKLDYYFTNQQYKKHTVKGVVNFNDLIKEDTSLDRILNDCYKSSGQTVLLEAQGFENQFIFHCVRNIQNSTEKNLDSNVLKTFCSCQLQMVRDKKISDAEMNTLGDPNSILFYEMMYTCGNPFMTKDEVVKNWDVNAVKDIEGPSADTIKTLTMNGMTFLKLKIGSLVQFWLFDTGSSDLLINTDMEQVLKKENIINESNYLGIGEYEMANGMIDTCRKYLVNNIQVGDFFVDNVVVAVTEKGKRIIAGKSLFNKFSNWIVNNRENILILSK